MTERIYFKEVVVTFTRPVNKNIFEFRARLKSSKDGVKQKHQLPINGRVYADEIMALSTVALNA